MKRLFYAALILILLMFFVAQIAPHPTKQPSNYTVTTEEDKTSCTEGVYEITISESLLYNNSVGDDWQMAYTCEGSSISSGKRWTVSLDTTKTVTIDIAITEDDKIPDVGSGSLSVSLADGSEASTIITVTENKGRFLGSTAQWQIACKVALVDRV